MILSLKIYSPLNVHHNRNLPFHFKIAENKNKLVTMRKEI